MLGTLATVFGDQIRRVLKASKVPTVVTEDNVYQEGDPVILSILDEMIIRLALPNSGVAGMKNLEELFDKAKSGKSCLLLVEHYSNMDLSVVSYLTRNAGGRGEEIGNSIIAISGMKLNEDNPAVAAFTGAYNKIVICPSRSLQHLDPEKDKDEIQRGNAINRAAMKALMNVKCAGHLILLFPSGTRYRPWDPSTKQGVREIDSYIKSFDYMCLVAINGQILHVRQGDMMDDPVSKDVVRLSIGPVVSCAEFRDRVRAGVDAAAASGAVSGAASDAAPGGEKPADKKQAVADAIMAELEKMHVEGEEKRKRFL